MSEEWNIKILDVGYKVEREVYIFRRGLGGTELIQSDGTLLFVPKDSANPPKPTIELNPEALQALSDELARVGYKPEKGFVQGKLEATENHLKDMRTLLKLK